ncbi:hypothetical protein BGX33_011233 [Mortierella sp. NVP41]|nr:hypothetical protein BGX33_011233 [Mortierella sp. NVP41]
MSAPTTFSNPALEKLLRFPVTQDMINFVAKKASSVTTCDPLPSSLDNGADTLASPSSDDPLSPTSSLAATLLSTVVHLDRLKEKLDDGSSSMYCTCHRVFLATLIIKHKYINDKWFGNIAWADYASFFTLRQVNMLEMGVLYGLDYNLIITEADLTSALEDLMCVEVAKSSTSFSSTNASAIALSRHCVSDADSSSVMTSNTTKVSGARTSTATAAPSRLCTSSVASAPSRHCDADANPSSVVTSKTAKASIAPTWASSTAPTRQANGSYYQSIPHHQQPSSNQRTSTYSHGGRTQVQNSHHNQPHRHQPQQQKQQQQKQKQVQKQTYQSQQSGFRNRRNKPCFTSYFTF